MCDSLQVNTHRGRTKIEPGAWSLAVSLRMAELIDSKEGKRDAFAKATGFSTRLNQLLNGTRAWYLEDVERACNGLGLDLVEFLDSLGISAGQPHPALASVSRFPVSDGAPMLAAVADEQVEELGSESAPDFDNA